jgi:hypothetical protein
LNYDFLVVFANFLGFVRAEQSCAAGKNEVWAEQSCAAGKKDVLAEQTCAAGKKEVRAEQSCAAGKKRSERNKVAILKTEEQAGSFQKAEKFQRSGSGKEE